MNYSNASPIGRLWHALFGVHESICSLSLSIPESPADARERLSQMLRVRGNLSAWPVEDRSRGDFVRLVAREREFVLARTLDLRGEFVETSTGSRLDAECSSPSAPNFRAERAASIAGSILLGLAALLFWASSGESSELMAAIALSGAGAFVCQAVRHRQLAQAARALSDLVASSLAPRPESLELNRP
jgi:hypothetical protein